MKRAILKKIVGLMLPLLAWMTAFSAGAQSISSSLIPVKGEKWPNSREEGDHPVADWAMAPTEKFMDSGFTDLVPYVLPSPDQQDAGSCLYMSLTGIAEWWLNRLNKISSPQIEGPYDLSERYLMNISADEENKDLLKNWRTDSIYLFNMAGKALSNHSYRFTQGWYKENEEGDYVKSKKGEEGALYGTPYNWIREQGQVQSGYVNLPHFEREVLFADPEGNQWGVGVTPADIVSRMKAALTSNGAPLNVIYNHYGYWHSVMVVGFNDETPTDQCHFIKANVESARKNAEEYGKKADAESNADAKEKLLKKVKSYTELMEKIKASSALKGCRGKGVFLVRDSIYSNPKEPMYDYDLDNAGEEDNYSSKIILREYEWAEILANHVVQISAK